MHTENSATAPSRKHSCKWFGFCCCCWLGFFALFENAPRKAKCKQEASALSGQNLTEKGHDSLKIKKPTRSSARWLLLLQKRGCPTKCRGASLPDVPAKFSLFRDRLRLPPPSTLASPVRPPGARPRPRRRVGAGGRAAPAGHRTGRAGQGEGPAAAERIGVRDPTCQRGTARPDPRAPGGAGRWGGRREQTIEPAQPHPERGSPRRCSAGPRAQGDVSSRRGVKVAGRGGQQGCGVPPSPPAMWLRGRVASRLPSLFAGGRDAHAHPSSPGWVSPAPTPAAPTPPSPGQLRQGTATACPPRPGRPLSTTPRRQRSWRAHSQPAAPGWVRPQPPPPADSPGKRWKPTAQPAGARSFTPAPRLASLHPTLGAAPGSPGQVPGPWGEGEWQPRRERPQRHHPDGPNGPRAAVPRRTWSCSCHWGPCPKRWLWWSWRQGRRRWSKGKGLRWEANGEWRSRDRSSLSLPASPCCCRWQLQPPPAPAAPFIATLRPAP